MMHPEKKIRKCFKAQAMVEFALVLPVLILLVYGMIEVGRLIFMYSIVVTASREAVRYGSATGLPGGSFMYQDCNGIIAAAQNVDFLSSFEDSDIIISYDNGPGTSDFSNCPPAAIETGDRIKVQVSAQYAPITPLIPLEPFVITSSSARTIIQEIRIVGTGTPIPPP